MWEMTIPAVVEAVEGEVTMMLSQIRKREMAPGKAALAPVMKKAYRADIQGEHWAHILNATWAVAGPLVLFLP